MIYTTGGELHEPFEKTRIIRLSNSNLSSIIDAGNLLLLEMERDDAAYETLYHLNDVIIPDMNRALEKAEELILYLSGYAQMLIDTYNHNNGGE